MNPICIGEIPAVRLPQPAPRDAGRGKQPWAMPTRLREGGRPGGIVPQAPHATPGIVVQPGAMTVAVIMAGLVPVMPGEGTESAVMRRIAAPRVGGMLTAPPQASGRMRKEPVAPAFFAERE